MITKRQDDFSLHMRIPADKCFVNNALLTLDGICDHFSFTETSRDRIKKALETALNCSIDFSYQKIAGLFNLQFSIYKEKMLIMIEDFPMNNGENLDANSEAVRNNLNELEALTDSLLFTEKKGMNACYSMAFNVSYISEDNN